MKKNIFGIISLLLVITASVFVFINSARHVTPTIPVDDGIAKILSDTLSTTTNPATPGSANSNNYSSVDLQFPNGVIHAMIASTSAEQELGLGQRDSLPADEGMVFPFSMPGNYGFWMKDMRFPLDVVWISPNKKVVGITSGLTPETYPTVFFPPTPITYVLEINSGATKKFGIATGTQLVF